MKQKWEGWAEISGTVNLLQISDQFFKASDQILKNNKLMGINSDCPKSNRNNCQHPNVIL